MAKEWQKGDMIPDPETGRGRWEIYKILGGPKKSGMGIVYVVYDHKWHESLAAKTFQDEVFARDPSIAEGFTFEALNWVKLDSHQNVARAWFVQNIRGKPFLFLEYVSGGDLESWIGVRLTNDLSQVLRFAIQFCDGMVHALSKGIQAHRDIKPQNCLVTQDKNLKVTDFGLAKVFDDTSPDAAHVAPSVARPANKWEESNVGFGTPLYMAPEQFVNAKHVDVRADIYSFGVMLFQMVTGRLPFEGRTWEDFARLHTKAALPPLKSGQSALDTIVGKCLAKLAGERYAGFGTLREELACIYENVTKQWAPKPASGSKLNAAELNDKGLSLSNLGHSEEALGYYDRALALDPEYALAWDNKGAALGHLGRYEEELTCIDRALALNPEHALAWYNKGVELGRLGRHEEGLACYERALAVDLQNALAWDSKGFALWSLGRPEEALACYDRALAINSQFEEAWVNKGAALWSLGRPEEALACYDRALAINSQLAGAWVNRGVMLKSLWRPKEALACYDRALVINPQFALAWYNKGDALESLGRPGEALACFNCALAINPQYARAWGNKGNALERLGHHEEALACYDRGLAINPQFVEAWFNKGAVLVNQFKRAREALPCFEQAQRLGHPNAAQAIALCLKALRSTG